MESSDESLPDELRHRNYEAQVLLLDESCTEHAIEEALLDEAVSLGILHDSRPKLRSTSLECTSDITVLTQIAGVSTFGSDNSISTAPTSRSSTPPNEQTNASQEAGEKARQRTLSFSDYQKFVEQFQQVASPCSNKSFDLPARSHRTPSLFSVSTRTSYNNLKSGLKNKFRLKRYKSSGELSSCLVCREGSQTGKVLSLLPCGHKVCNACLRVLVKQASLTEASMPPRCCQEAVPGGIIKSVLTEAEQQRFLEAVDEYSVPWGQRLYCPNKICSRLIPKSDDIDPRNPFQRICKRCHTKACSICNGPAHPPGDCPDDWERRKLSSYSEDRIWKRCYRCRILVELEECDPYISCPCGGKMCHSCGAVWDLITGCPNACDNEVTNGQDQEKENSFQLANEEQVGELQVSSDERQTEEHFMEVAEQVEEELTLEDPSQELLDLQEHQNAEKDRFNVFERKMKWAMWTRHGQMKLDILDRHAKEDLKIKDAQAIAVSTLEDRQVSAEMELRAALEQAEKSVYIRLKHMEAYCSALGRQGQIATPARVVTERDLRELGQQYNERDNMARLHESKINVMRDQQGKQMERLLARLDGDLDRLAEKHAVELEDLEQKFLEEKDHFARLCQERKERLKKRWKLVEDIERKKLYQSTGVRYASLPLIEWTDGNPPRARTLEAVAE